MGSHLPWCLCSNTFLRLVIVLGLCVFSLYSKATHELIDQPRCKVYVPTFSEVP